MKCLLVGNGLDIMLGSKLTLDGIRKAILNKDNKFGSLPYPENVKEFWTKNFKNNKESKWYKKDSLLKDSDYKTLKYELENCKVANLEMWMIKIAESLDNYALEAQIKAMFIKYIELDSESIQTDRLLANVYGDDTSKKVNYLVNKLKEYDVIFTTNYDNIIEKLINDPKSEKIVHLHGTIKDDDYVLDEKNKIIQVAKKAVFKSILNHESVFKDKAKKVRKDNGPLISLDCLGWSLGNEEDIIDMILERCAAYIFEYLKLDGENNGNTYSRKELMNDEELQTFLNNLFEINYYYHTLADLESIYRSNYVCKNPGRGFDTRKFITLSSGKCMNSTEGSSILEESNITKTIKIDVMKMKMSRLRIKDEDYKIGEEQLWRLNSGMRTQQVVFSEDADYDKYVKELKEEYSAGKITNSDYAQHMTFANNHHKNDKIMSNWDIYGDKGGWENDYTFKNVSTKINLYRDDKFMRNENNDYVVWDRNTGTWIIW